MDELTRLSSVQLRISNIVVESCMNNFYAIRNKNYKVAKKEVRRTIIAGNLLLESSLSCVKYVSKRIKLAKRIGLEESKRTLAALRRSIGHTSLVIADIPNLINSENRDGLLKSFSEIIKIADGLYDLSESSLFQRFNDTIKSDYFFILQDEKLNMFSNDIVDAYRKNKDQIESIIKNKKFEIALEKSINRLDGHLKRIKSLENLMSDDLDIELTVRLAKIV